MCKVRGTREVLRRDGRDPIGVWVAVMSRTTPAQAQPADWSASTVVTFAGQHDTHLHDGHNYRSITLWDAFELAKAPGNRPKPSALAMIPSSYHQHDARNHATQRQHGRYAAVCADIDKGGQSLEVLEPLVRGFCNGAAFCIFSTSSAMADAPKWRVIVPLADALPFLDWQAATAALGDYLQSHGVVVDRALERAGQLVCLPNVPPDKRGPDGTPLFYQYALALGPGLEPGCGVTGEWVARHHEHKRQEEARKRAARDAALAAALAAREARQSRPAGGSGASVIDEFNRGHDYEQSDDGSDDWRSPNQQSGSYATRTYGETWVSLSESDAIAGLGSEAHGCRWGDAFDLYKHFAHGGDERAAVTAAAALMGMANTKSASITPIRTLVLSNPGNLAQRQEMDAEWGSPQPFGLQLNSDPYPLDVLPPVLRDAVAEVQGFVKAPMAMVAQSALASLSLAGQALIDVHRAEKLEGPVSLFMLTLGDSGERKTATDKQFTRVITDYQNEQQEAAKPEVASYRASVDAWKAEREGVLTAIRELSKKGKDTVQKRRELDELEHIKPREPRIPELIVGDETAGNLPFHLAHKWPSAGVFCSEAGAILGSHAMGESTRMSMLSLWNILWDGGELKVGRKTTDSFRVRGARLSMNLMVQPATLAEFNDKTNGIARGIGLWARCLIALPESTQGTRMFDEPPASTPCLTRFNRQIRNILDLPVPIDDDGRLCPRLMMPSPEAKQEWIAYHDEVEVQLRPDGAFADVRDVASKSADVAARLAALFQLFEAPESGVVSGENMARGATIARWNLNEARRFFGSLALPQEQVDAVRLEGWLLAECRAAGSTRIPTQRAQQYAPGPLRRRDQLDKALAELAELDRARIVMDGRRKFIEINPALA